MPSKKELKELVRSLTAKNIELNKQIAAKDVIIEKLNKQIAAKDVKISNLNKQIAVMDDVISKTTNQLAVVTATMNEKDVVIERLKKDVDLSNRVNVVFGKVLTDLKKYESAILPTTCAQNCLRV
jgi:uncharacterized coiled-coil protein SlyX